MSNPFVSWDIDRVIVAEPLPGALYLFLDSRFIRYKNAGDCIDRELHEKLLLKRVKILFVTESDKSLFDEWFKKNIAALKPDDPQSPEEKSLRTTLDAMGKCVQSLFETRAESPKVQKALDLSQDLTRKMMDMPNVQIQLSKLQSYSPTVYGHSLNVAVLSTYCGVKLGYTHQMILQNLCLGGLLHDIGKAVIKVNEKTTDAEITAQYLSHPLLGIEVLKDTDGITDEIRMIVAQHHECWDGSGYPEKMRGNKIYDLARIVAITNIFDELVMNGSGSLRKRQRDAVASLNNDMYRKFDQVKLDKIVAILKSGL